MTQGEFRGILKAAEPLRLLLGMQLVPINSIESNTVTVVILSRGYRTTVRLESLAQLETEMGNFHRWLQENAVK